MSVRPAVCPSLCLSTPWTLLCTDQISAIPQGISFSFRTWSEHILKLCVGVLFLKYFKNCNSGEFRKMVIWELRHIDRDNAYIVMW